MKSLYLVLFWLLPVLFCLPSWSQEESPQIYLDVPEGPSISRFKGFTGSVRQSSAIRLRRDSFKVFANEQDLTAGLKVEEDPGTGDLFLSFKPGAPLPEGKVLMKLLCLTVGGGLVTRDWSFLVDPSLDDYLRSYVQYVRRRPMDSLAHYNLARALEEKYLLEDAQHEYHVAWIMEPRNDKAKLAFERIFALWDRKTLASKGVSVEAALDESLVNTGNLLFFKVTLDNQTESKVAVKGSAAILTDPLGGQQEPIGSLLTYPKEAFESGLITLDDYARVTYFLERHPRSLLGDETAYPGVTLSGHVAFKLARKETKNFTFLLPVVYKEGDVSTFSFPFTRP
ncbi:MAG: hypothetical protein HYU64_07225 [Armatimonadetes bacterium]|nr:hypothetical protein [Armatimonadota bacterium]